MIRGRLRHGLMASSDSQMVVPEISAAVPRATTSTEMSGTCRRGTGTPKRLGSSQASTFTETTTSGGKDLRSATSGTFFEAGEALQVEAFAPLRHDLATGVQAGSDHVIVETVCGHEHDLARTTSRYCNVYLRALASSSLR